jgi:predicted alpha/beta hydrolase family esterase
MRQILFVQGAGKGVHDQWDNQLVDSLKRELEPAYDIRYPAMPNEADPAYAAWKPVIERELAVLEHGAIVIGHSVGGTILIHALAERTPQCNLGAICLIAAPLIGPGGWTIDDFEPLHDLEHRLPRGVPIFFYHGRDDDIVPFAHVELYACAVPSARVRRLAGRDHQLGNDLSEVTADIRGLDQSSNAEATRGSEDVQSSRDIDSRGP